jgi:type IV pilus assembly protein PilW
MLMALAIGSLLLGSLYNFYVTQKNVSDIREQTAEMQQNARIAMALMVREIRMAGYNPTDTTGVGGIMIAEPHRIRITMDLNGDGDTNDANEDLTYSLYDSGGDGDDDLGRRPANGDNQPVAENIESLSFAYLADTMTPAANPAHIRLVRITLTARTARPDRGYPTNGGYRTYTLTSMITPRNLTYQ